MKRRHFILLLGGGSAGALSVGTGAFSSVDAERDVEVNVVEDEKAYVGYEEADKTIPADLRNDGTIHLVTITNRFSQSISIVNVEIGDGADKLTDVSYDESSFGPGKTAEITGSIKALPPGESVEVEITVTVQGTDVKAQLFGDTQTRRFTIERSDQDVNLASTKVEYFGRGNAEILNDNETVSVDIYLFDKETDSITHISESIDTNNKIKGKQLSGGDKIVGVTLDGTTYIHPQWNSKTCSFDQPNNGGFGAPSDSPPSCVSGDTE